jgi:hypothetical protein
MNGTIFQLKWHDFPNQMTEFSNQLISNKWFLNEWSHNVASILVYDIRNPIKDCPAPQRNAT